MTKTTPHERLVLMQKINFIQGTAAYDSKVEVAFQPLGDHARMLLTLHPHPDPH